MDLPIHFFVSNFIIFFSQFSDHPAKLLVILHVTTCLAILLFEELGGFSFTTVLQRCPFRRAMGPQPPSLRWASHVTKHHL